MRLHAGSSGFAYREWKGRFYPRGLPAARMLAHYAGRFDAVEINSSFYDLPTAAGVAAWAREVPPAFRFAFKAPGRITHQKRLAGAGALVDELFAAVGVLGGRLGPVLFGLPPNLKKDLPRLEAFLDALPPRRRVAFEFRHESWLSPDVYAALRRRRAALCIADTDELVTPFVATAPFGYLRLRRARYTTRALDAWVEKIRAQRWSEAYVFFRHEDEARAPRLAARLSARFAARARPDAPGPPPDPASR